jgi:hypothetical protein
MRSNRIIPLAIAADVVAVVVFAALGRSAHGESGDLPGLLGTAAPFLVGLGAAWATPLVRAHPAGLRAGAAVVAGAGLLGVVLRAGFTGSLPLTFALISVGTLGVLMLGWRALSMAVAHRAGQRVR